MTPEHTKDSEINIPSTRAGLNYKNLMPVASLIAVCLSGCEGNVDVPNQSGNFYDGGVVDADASDGANTDPNLTRGQFVTSLVQDVMGYKDNKPCMPLFPDVTANTDLCRAAEIAHKRGIAGYPDGTFKPDGFLNHAEVWKDVAQVLGFAPYGAPCIQGVQDVPSDSWFYDYAGALCSKGVHIIDSNNHGNPADLTTVTQYQSIAHDINAYLSGSLDRISALEPALTVIKNDFMVDPNCVSQFSDITAGSLECMVTEKGVADNIVNPINPTPAQFYPHSTFDWAQLAKLDVEAGNIPMNGCTGCTGADPASWFCSYADALCGKGLLDKGFVAVETMTPTIKQAYKLAWDIQLAQ